jgi:hypothetical protein
MISYDKSRAKAAVQFLVDSSYFRHHVTKLRNTVEKPRALPFKEESEALNELLVIGRQNLQAMENLISVAEYKRSNKNDYQREYMAAKRQRDRKVLQLEALMSDKPVAIPHRKAVLEHQYKVWNKERDTLLSRNKDLNWTERNRMLKNFWDLKEAELNGLIEEAKKNGPVKRQPKRVVTVKQEPKSPFGSALANALKK